VDDYGQNNTGNYTLYLNKLNPPALSQTTISNGRQPLKKIDNCCFGVDDFQDFIAMTLRSTPAIGSASELISKLRRPEAVSERNMLGIWKLALL
jgi:hypothetical protein